MSIWIYNHEQRTDKKEVSLNQLKCHSEPHSQTCVKKFCLSDECGSPSFESGKDLAGLKLLWSLPNKAHAWNAQCPRLPVPQSLRNCCSCDLGPGWEALCLARLTWSISRPLFASAGPDTNSQQGQGGRCELATSRVLKLQVLPRLRELTVSLQTLIGSLSPSPTQRQVSFLLWA